MSDPKWTPERDDLAPARGIYHGLLISAAIWAALFIWVRC
jgi:hypothetical protein